MTGFYLTLYIFLLFDNKHIILIVLNFKKLNQITSILLYVEQHKRDLVYTY